MPSAYSGRAGCLATYSGEGEEGSLVSQPVFKPGQLAAIQPSVWHIDIIYSREGREVHQAVMFPASCGLYPSLYLIFGTLELEQTPPPSSSLPFHFTTFTPRTFLCLPPTSQPSCMPAYLPFPSLPTAHLLAALTLT